jgi:hypothetical protein
MNWRLGWLKGLYEYHQGTARSIMRRDCKHKFYAPKSF